MVRTNWGVIYAQRKERRGLKRWRNICQYLRSEGVSFDYFIAESAQDVTNTAARMTREGYRTLIVVGGDVALYQALNGIMTAALTPEERPALGIIPNGYVNDFARYWGFDKDYRAAIKALIRRRIRKIDVGEVRLKGKTVSSTHYFLNCVNIGVVASIMNLRLQTHRLFSWGVVAYLISAFALLFQRMVFQLDMKLNAETYRRKVMNLCVGSCRGYGLTPSAVPYNGKLDVSSVRYPQLIGVFQGIWLLLTGRFLGLKNVDSWRTTNIVLHAKGEARVSVDGWVIDDPCSDMEIQLLPEAIEFLIAE